MYRCLLSTGLTPSTVGNVHVILKQALRDAVRDKYIRSNPLDDVKPPKQKASESPLKPFSWLSEVYSPPILRMGR